MSQIAPAPAQRRLHRPWLSLTAKLTEQLCAAPPPAARVVDRFVREHRQIGRRDAAFVVEAAWAWLRTPTWWAHMASALPDATREDEILLVALVQMHWPAESFPVDEARREALQAAAGSAGARLAAAFPDPLQQLATRYDLPLVWLAAWRDAVGLEGAEERAAALRTRASMTVRVNRLRTTREATQRALQAGGVVAVPAPFSPDGLVLEGHPKLENTELFRLGWVEVQDEGSQLLALACAPQPGQTVVDACAGAGGKTLALAALMHGKGRLVALDVDASRLARLPERAQRAGLPSIELAVLTDVEGTSRGPRQATAAFPLPGWREADAMRRLQQRADLVLVDAPCSGVGTLRRNPELARATDDARLAFYTRTQAQILSRARHWVRPGGVLAYATCSLLPAENEAQVARFLDQNAGWTVVDTRLRLLDAGVVLPDAAPDQGPHGLHLTPWQHGTDGFFLALLKRPT